MTARLTRPAWGAAMLSALALNPSLPARAAQANPPSTAAIGVDVTVTHAVLGHDGEAASPDGLPTSFRLERQQTANGWRTVITYRARTTEAASRASANPLDGARMEYDDGARRARVYDRAGRLNPRLSSEASGPGLPVFDGATRWLDSLVADPERVLERRRALVAAHGAPVGRTRKLDRYLSNDGNAVEEVLADPESGLVMEINRADNGTIERRTTFDYSALPDGRWFRRAVRSEEAARDGTGKRTVVSVVFSNLTIGPAR